MKKRYIPLLLALVLTLLWGCSAPGGQATESTPPATEPPTTAAPTETPTEPPTHPPTEAPTEPPTEPPVVLDPGPSVYVDGTPISRTGLLDGTVYVSAAEFCSALGGDNLEDGVSTLLYHDVSYTFSNAYSHIMRGQRATVLLSPVVSCDQQAFLPLEELCQMLELSVFHDSEMNTLYCTASAWPREIPEGYDVPVLMYHAVDDDLSLGIAELLVKPSEMEEQLIYLTENGYDPIFFEDLYNIDQYDKPVILTFDDGYEDNYTILFPLLRKYNVKATVFMISEFVGRKYYLTEEQLLEMANSGLVSIQSHTATHPYLDSMNQEEQRHELESSKLTLMRITHREPFVLCYPTGKYDADTLAVIGDSYHMGIKMNGGLYTTGDSPYEINRYYISRYTEMSTYIARLEDIFA